MITYLASPIDLAGKQPVADTARHELRSHLRSLGSQVYEPANAWSLDIHKTDPDEMYKLSDINFYALDQADLLVALAPPGVPSIGVPIEVYHALTLTDARVALWFGDGFGVLGAVWNYLIKEFSGRVYLIPPTFDSRDVQHLLAWTKDPLAEMLS